MFTLVVNMHSVWVCECELYFTGQWSIRCACALTLNRCHSCHRRTSLLWVGRTCSHLQSRLWCSSSQHSSWGHL